MKTLTQILLLGTLLIIISCCNNEPKIEDSLTHITYSPTAVQLEYPIYTQLVQGHEVKLPTMNIPVDNPLTEEGIDLGRHLFYDTKLSADNSMSCASCHLPEGSFTDNFAFSRGVDGILGTRSSMSLLNVGFYDKGLFWDGRSATLETQALAPVEDVIELHEEWPNVIKKLKETDLYPEKFRKAFGIERTSDITKELAAKAISQFERTIFSFESKFDRYLKGLAVLDDDELYGFEMYFEIEGAEGPDAQCWHCHGLPLLTSNDYFNNGLIAAETLDDFIDIGRGKITGKAENGFFRATSLKNIALTAPYMHDGSLQTLEEVIDHYSSGGKPSPNKDPLISDIHLSEYDKEALLKFLHTLTDDVVINRPDLQNPF
ncbi:MAG: cytochrome c peroxidase [Saprospiraceae bacterium]